MIILNNPVNTGQRMEHEKKHTNIDERSGTKDSTLYRNNFKRKMRFTGK